MRLSRVHYHSDTAGTAQMIQNILLRYLCLDRSHIAGYGFLQGAGFVVEFATAEPTLFKEVVAGSDYYQPTMRETIRVLPVSFFTAVSKNDMGIFEQGSVGGRRFARC